MQLSSAPLILSKLDREVENSPCVCQFVLNLSSTQFNAKIFCSDNLSTGLYVRHILKIYVFCDITPCSLVQITRLYIAADILVCY